jgi:FkbM family methyltransferase
MAPHTPPGLIDFLQARDIDVVFDVGANDGHFGLWLRECGYRGRIVSFEPIRAVFDLLKVRADEDGDWDAHPVALGEQRGKAVINVAELSVFSSLLPQRNAATAFDAGAAPARTEAVAVAPLDQFAPDYASRTCFLKSDTQGFERQVLLGAKATLPILKGVQLELPIIQFYSGVWGISDAISFMSREGFVIAQIHPVNYHPADPVSWVEADCVFRRAEPLID